MDRLLAQNIPSPRGFASIRVKIGRLRGYVLPIVTKRQPLNKFHSRPPERLRRQNTRKSVILRLHKHEVVVAHRINVRTLLRVLTPALLIARLSFYTWGILVHGDERIICIMRPPGHWQ
ncbi:hypothetical protein EAE96_007974 [Botrytis aclada]|nr:hypothetical protein EAE96_007974 [Botrytis aclada]